MTKKDLLFNIIEFIKYLSKEIEFKDLSLYQSNSNISVKTLNKRLSIFKKEIEKLNIINIIALESILFNKHSKVIEISKGKDYLVKWLSKYIDDQSNIFTPTKIHEYAYIHDTHNNSKLDVIKKKNKYILYKENNVTKVLDLFNSSIDTFKDKNIIILENQYIFDLSIKDLKLYLENFNIENINLENCIVVYGAGSWISSKRDKLKSIFNKTQYIYYFGDLDDEGYDIYRTFMNNINIESEFILPIKNKYIEIQNIMNEEKYINIRNKENNFYLSKDRLLYHYIKEEYNINSFNKLFIINQECYLNY